MRFIDALANLQRAGQLHRSLRRATHGIVWLVLPLALPAMASCPAASTTDLAHIKGIGEQSALAEGQRVTIDGVVTGEFLGRERLSGFYLQQTTEQGPVGMFVYAPELAEHKVAQVVAGQHLQLQARTGSFRGNPQLQRVTQLVTCDSAGELPEPIALSWPQDAASLDAMEALLVTFPEPLTVTDNHDLGRYGTLGLASERRFRPTHSAAQAAPSPAPLLLDDGSYRTNPDPVPYLNEQGSRRVGSTLDGLTGVLTHAFGDYRLHPTQAVTFTDSNPRPGPLEAPGDALRVATFNVENYFITLGERGAANAPALERQRGKLAAAIAGLEADILALIEIENRPDALTDLVEQLHQRTGIRYQPVGEPERHGTDAIRVALLYRPDRVEALGALHIDRDDAHDRPPLAGFFRSVRGGPEVGVVTAHFKAKSGCPAQGDIDRGQGCWNERRVAQAQATQRFLDTLREEAGHERLLLLGDLNAYGAEDPIRTLVHAGMTDLIARHLPAERRYTYVFRGESGYLDHALASAELAEAVQQVHTWPINADEPRFLSYDQQPDDTPPNPFRSSDHDPIAVDLVWP
ncbi:ExeM/NucH family extracellular endonuclease [Halomonas sp. NyZ770]|uniref:ExeM/NucH family extracellular endonuclease n=1 Tax=Halomonas sp. NyZ770 TaxID=2883106 RepID=UPI00068F642D|nr:ExeM/NucH family extracellular endonuclease [Halomonas sp. NyZ770]UDM07604.1 ExeM/NucH family extracellular endonuclease [Halomonas sp. NyZ770]